MNVALGPRFLIPAPEERFRMMMRRVRLVRAHTNGFYRLAGYVCFLYVLADKCKR